MGRSRPTQPRGARPKTLAREAAPSFTAEDLEGLSGVYPHGEGWRLQAGDFENATETELRAVLLQSTTCGELAVSSKRRRLQGPAEGDADEEHEGATEDLEAPSPAAEAGGWGDVAAEESVVAAGGEATADADAAAAETGVRLPQRRVGAGRRSQMSVALNREILEMQRTTHLLIPKGAFGKLVREVVHTLELLEGRGNGIRMAPAALEVMHQAAEAYLISVLECANSCAHRARRVTVMRKDMRLVASLRPL